MAKRSTLLGLAVGSFLLAAPALAQVSTTAQDAMIPPASTYMHGVPYGTSDGSDGQYVESGTYYNNAPIYQRTGNTGVLWSLYKRADGKWYVDFNTVSEDWDGTVAYTNSAQAWPWTNSAWSNGVISFRTAQVNVQNIPYATSAGSAGDYTYSGTVYNSAPVYQRVSNGTTWSLYKRADGKWYVDFNTVSEDWDGTVAYSTAAAWPWSATWNSSSYLFFRTKMVFLYGLPNPGAGSNGAYTFSGQTYNNAPVYQRQLAGGVVWSLYKRADGKWYVDGNAISEDADGTQASTSAAASWPWLASWANNVLAFRTARVSVQGAPYSSNGAAGEYLFSGQIYSGAPVYQRPISGGGMWSLYKRSGGSWYVDFNTVSEDWDGTVAYTTAAASNPWSATWNASTAAVDLFAEE